MILRLTGYLRPRGPISRGNRSLIGNLHPGVDRNRALQSRIRPIFVPIRFSWSEERLMEPRLPLTPLITHVWRKEKTKTKRKERERRKKERKKERRPSPCLVFPPLVLDHLYESYPCRGFLVVKSRQSDLYTDRGCVLWFYERGPLQRDETPDQADGFSLVK